MTTLVRRISRTLLPGLALFFLAWNADGQTTAFNYAGSLNSNGTPANGTYDFQFALYQVATGGAAGAVQPVNNVSVSGGQFNVTLDFGDAFSDGGPRYLEISVSPSGNNSFVVTGPRTAILSSPYAITAKTLSLPAHLKTFGSPSDQALIITNAVPPGKDVFTVNANGGVTANSYSVTDTNSFFVGPNGDVAGRSFETGGFTVGAAGNINANSMTLQGDLNVIGNKHALVALPSGKSIYMSAVESPETWFEDFGTAKLTHGATWVAIDKKFAETSNLENGYHVFLTPSGNSRGLYVHKKTASGFEIRETDGGRSNIEFDYRIVARRRGYEKERFKEALPATQQQ